MKQLVFFTFLAILSTSNLFSQYASVKLNLSIRNEQDKFDIYFGIDESVILSEFGTNNLQKEIDSLIPGDYYVNVYSEGNQTEKIISKKYTLTENETLEINLDLNLFEDRTGPNIPPAILEEVIDIQVNLAYHQNDWTKESSLFTKNFSTKLDYNFYRYKNHFAFASGGGYEYLRNTMNRDSSLFSNLPDTITKEFYHQFTLNFYAKIRFFSGKVLTKKYQPKLFLDLGLGYYFPVFKRHVAEIDNEFKYVEKHIGIPNDLRVFVNFGWHPVNLFASYRIFNSYQTGIPQTTKYQFGLTYTLVGE